MHVSGSSPLTRGKRVSLPLALEALGLIPAHAGKTGETLERGAHPEAHPRSRGENSRPPGRASRRAGSSPLTRGKRWWRPPPSTRCGLIPAHAGKTCPAWPGRLIAWAHPRSRGENAMRAFTGALMKGSSPLTRGKPERRGRWQCRDGLIPAHAGKTSVTVTATVTAWAHPRSRGENSGTASRPRSTTGSSPLTRGKLWDGIKTSINNGLIPAHAGKTPDRLGGHQDGRAHPRSRGENANFLGGVVSSPGSSPLTRGKHRVRDHARARQGLIPAHAGKTRGRPSSRALQTAHPRSRGENSRWT